MVWEMPRRRPVDSPKPRSEIRRMSQGEILCVGEVLWDSLPAGLFLGGAPFNVACHLNRSGARATMVSRVGSDRLGEEAVRRGAGYGVATDLIQVDDALPTGFVRATVDEAGEAHYEILSPAAWDAIEITSHLVARAEQARAIVFGTLAQRDARSRSTIERLWRGDALKVCDVNLRPPFDDRAIVRRSLEHSDVVKVSREELKRLAAWFQLPAGEHAAVVQIARDFECDVVCVTRGIDGAALWRNEEWTEHPGFRVQVRDTVGAGDAFLAMLLIGLLEGTDSASVLERANQTGASVAAQFGAVPAGADAGPVTTSVRMPSRSRPDRDRR